MKEEFNSWVNIVLAFPLSTPLELFTLYLKEAYLLFLVSLKCQCQDSCALEPLLSTVKVDLKTELSN